MRMKSFFFIIFIANVFSQVYNRNIDENCECGISSENRRIVGGTNVAPHTYPWLVALTLGSRLHCGGAIITELHVLTAGHCVAFGVKCSDLTVHVGMHDRLSSEHETRRVRNGQKHPNFTSNAVRDINDIAVLRLDHQLTFNSKVRPICLPISTIHVADNQLTVAGWGKTKQGAATSSRFLLETNVQVVSSTMCKKSNTYRENLVPDTMMCAYNVGKDACQGDSGGPLFLKGPSNNGNKWYQVGIVSWGIDCAMPGNPGVYTVVSKYLGWIKEQTKDGHYCRT